jgi:replicative DNA helicase
MKVGNREQEISAISRELKAMTLEFDIPIIALSQLSRAVDSRQNQRPQLSDLRESGSLEQDADNVVFFFRPAYYAQKAGQTVPEYEVGNMEYILAKGRETGLGKYLISVDFASNTLFNQWFDHNNSDEFFENRKMKKRQHMKIAPPPPSKT